MKEKYVILKQSGKEIIGDFYLEDNKIAKIILNPNIDMKLIPIHFRQFHQKKVYIIENNQVYKWIKTRIPPQYRQDISDILKCLNLTKYDEYQIFKAYNGKSVRDDYYIQKVE